MHPSRMFLLRFIYSIFSLVFLLRFIYSLVGVDATVQHHMALGYTREFSEPGEGEGGGHEPFSVTFLIKVTKYKMY